jgi:hypothetical protein
MRFRDEREVAIMSLLAELDMGWETIPATGKNMVFLIFSCSMSEGIFFFLYSRWTPSWSDATQVVGTYLGVQLSHWTMFQEVVSPKMRFFKKGNEVSELTPNS